MVFIVVSCFDVLIYSEIIRCGQTPVSLSGDGNHSLVRFIARFAGLHLTIAVLSRVVRVHTQLDIENE